MSRLTLVYLFGVPGAGKSSLLGAALPILYEFHATPVPHEHYAPGLIHLGRSRGAFSGTDALALSIQPRAADFLADLVRLHPVLTVIAEGDRLANGRFWETAQALGYILDLLYLDCPADVAAARRAARGSRQSDTWLKGRATKVARLAAAWPHTRLDATLPLADLAAQLRTRPALCGLVDSSQR